MIAYKRIKVQRVCLSMLYTFKPNNMLTTHLIMIYVYFLDSKTNACKHDSSITNRNKSKDKVEKKKRHIASASTALLFGTMLGLIQTAILIFGAKLLLAAMGIKHVSKYLHYLNFNTFNKKILSPL